MPHLAIYYFDACPFCNIVLKAIKKSQIKVEYRDIYSNQAHLKKLQSDTGRRTTPCLYIDDVPMHESQEIIRWINDNIDNLEKNS